MTSWLKELLTSAPQSAPTADEDEPVQGLNACDICGSTRRTTSASGGTLCAACWLSGHGQTAQGKRIATPSNRASGSQGSLREDRQHDSQRSSALNRAGSMMDLRPNHTSASSSSSLPQPPARSSRRRSAKLQSVPEQSPGDDALEDLIRLPPASATIVAGKQTVSRAQSAASLSQLARSRPESYRDMKDGVRSKLLANHQMSRAQLAAENKSTPLEAEKTAPSSSSVDGTREEASRVRRRRDAEKMLRYRSALTQQPSQERGLPGGYRCGEIVQSLIARERSFSRVLEQGHEGMVVAAVPAPSSSSRSRSKENREGELPLSRLLVQFKLGFDWLLAPHQICPPSFLASTLAAGLPGGFVWGDRVRSLVECLTCRGKRGGLFLGDTGTIIGPGHTPGKVAVRFDDRGGEWNIWPGAVCRAEAYDTCVEAPLPGGLRRGDRVQTRAAKSASAGEMSGASHQFQLEDGDMGVIIGPGHADGRILVRFDVSGRAWSMMPAQLNPLAMETSSKANEASMERAAEHAAAGGTDSQNEQQS